MSTTFSYLHGQAVSPSAFNSANQALSLPGMAKPTAFNVVSGNVTVAPHSGVFGNGVAVSSDTPVTLAVAGTGAGYAFSVGASAYTGTILYRIDSSLYLKPAITIEPGYLVPGTDPTVLVLGWITYPGQSLAFQTSMCVPAQEASDFRYSYYATAKDIFRQLPLVTVNTAAPTSIYDPWYMAQQSTPTSPSGSLFLYLAQNNAYRTTTPDSALVMANTVNGEYITILKNPTGQATLNLVVELAMHNNDQYATSLHSRLSMDQGVGVTTGIQFRGQASELPLSTGSFIGTGIGNLGTYVCSASLVNLSGTWSGLLPFNIPSLLRETLIIRYHVALPGNACIGFGAVGLGNQNTFEQTYTAG
jgi:hypothetical protein